MDSHKNFSYSTVATAPSPATTGTTLIVQAGDGTKFPTVPFNATVWPSGAQPLAGNAEIVRVTDITTDTFTITRQQESTSARSVVIGDQIAATITNKVLTDIEAGTVPAATAESDFIAAGASPFAWLKKTLAEVKTILGLGTAAYTASGDYAIAAQGVTNGDSHDHAGGDGGQVDHGGLGGLGDDDHTIYVKHALATATSDFLAASGSGAYVKKTLAETKTILGVPTPGQIFLSGAGGFPSTTSGCAANAKVEMTTNKQNVYTLDFDAAAVENAEWTLAMPSDWDAGTLTAIFYWLANDTTTNAVVWCLQGGAYGDGDALDAAWGTMQTVTDANASTANQVRKSAATAAITLANTPAAGELAQFRCYRNATDGSDTLTVDARLLGIMVAYTRS